MRIAFLIATVHDIGGTAGAVVTQAGALCERHDVEILSVYGSAGTHFGIDPRVTVRDLVAPDDPALAHLVDRPSVLVAPGADPNLDARADVALEAALPGLQADVLVTVTPAMLAYAVQLAPAATAVVHQEHRSSSQRPHGRALLLHHARAADVVAMLTEPMAAWLRRELGDEAPTTVVVPNALAPGYRPRSTLDEPVILGAGRLATEKQWPHLISAFGRIADRVPEWRLRIFGEGHARFDAMGMVRKLGLWDRVELPGPSADLTSEWARASISALTSQPGEGFPLVIQESMAAGVPVVAYDMPSGPRDQITHGVDGLLVAQGSEAGLAAALLRLATDAAERRRLGDAAAATAATWSSAAITARWDEVYEEAVRRRRAAPAGRVRGALASREPAPRDQHEAPAGHEGTGTTPEQARHETLAAAVRVAASVAGSGGWFVVPPRAGTPAAPDGVPATVVLPMAVRRAFLEALLTADLPAHTSVHDPDNRGWPSRRGLPADAVPPLLRARTGRLLLEPFPRTDGRASLLGRGCGVAVEFWEEGVDGDLHSPGGATWTTTVPRDAATVPTRVHGVEVPTLPVMAGPSVYDVTFPVDVVYTWVDGADPAWNARREERLAATGDPSMRTRAASGAARYVDRGELRWSMRGVHLFLPWVRTVHVVTDGQVPAWLDPDHPQVNVVDHRDLLPADALPTFNSHAIEAAVHRIDGLAEHFLYLNDDFFVGAPAGPERFFTPAGQTVVFPSSTLVGLPGQAQLPWALAAANNRALLADAFGASTVHTLVHAPYAHRVSVLEEVTARYADAVAATVRAPFRSATDVSMLSSLAQHHGLLTGTAVAGRADYAFVDLTDPVVRRRLKQLLDRDREGFCLGDSHDYARDPATVAAMVAEFLDDYFPVPAPWERGPELSGGA